jgi:hypothetical protein
MSDIFVGTLSKIKAIYELVKTGNTSKLLLEISNLEKEFADLQISYAALQKENLALNEKIQSFEKDRNEPPIYKNGAYYSQKGDGPFCSGCYDNGKKLMRLSETPSSMRKMATHICPVCDKGYT